MEKYWEGVKNTEEIDRGLYIILPLRYQGDFQKIPFSAKKTNTDQNNKSDEEKDRSGFDSDDFLEILSIKCRSGEFVKRCMLEEKVATVKRKWKEAVKIPFPYDLAPSVHRKYSHTHFDICHKASEYWNCSFHQLQSSHQLWMKFSGPQPVLHV